MCLGVPGKVLTVTPNEVGMTMGTVSFGGIVKEVCLAYTPEAAPGDYVLVHVGFALSRLSEEHAREVFEVLERMGDLSDLTGDESPPGARGVAAARASGA